jgi:hypothetical protein
VHNHDDDFLLAASSFSGAASAVSGPSKSYWSLIKLYFAMNKYSPLSLMPQNRAVCGYHMGYIEDVELITSTMHELLSLYEQGLIKPQIDSVWAYSEVSDSCFGEDTFTVCGWKLGPTPYLFAILFNFRVSENISILKWFYSHFF